ncbi:hypothetical protein COU80_01590 [Candidatus Peregrinibacteria bacterium CG10_big_fil_rev_8_21_14_0_10_55_24]|nr:MAG: hypothetical protein COU80_01590 [Candidatus Peregrinibacteria bacterium CG10_big_fil_rev_8_21_14_0_10_55_24]
MPIREFIAQIVARPAAAVKVFFTALAAVIVVVFAIRLVGSTVEPLLRNTGTMLNEQAAKFSEEMGYYESNDAQMDMGMAATRGSVPSPSSVPIPQDEGSVGPDAEEYEVTEYNGTIKTRDLEDTCGEIEALKTRGEVIFENANRYERGCYYAFKVEKAFTEELLAIIEGLNPDTLSANTYTIKRLVEDYTSELEILEQKMAAIDETFESAKEAYAEIEALARNTRDAESLATVIDSKVQMIERLTQQRISVSEQLDRMQRAMADQIDRLDYTRFSISVEEDKFVDGKDIRDSWKAAVKGFVRDLNTVVQDVSINLITTVLVILQYVLYFFILLIVAKYAWRGARAVWRR